MVETKPLLKSKTIWVGIIESGLGILDMLFGASVFSCTLNQDLPAGLLLLLSGGLKIALRAITNKAVTIL